MPGSRLSVAVPDSIATLQKRIQFLGETANCKLPADMDLPAAAKMRQGQDRCLGGKPQPAMLERDRA
jgi:hypothetical protein